MEVNYMEKKLESISWVDNRSFLGSYVFPPDKRPGNSIVPPAKSIPVVDLGGHDPADIIQQIMNASHDFGFFQVINHGVCRNLMDDTANVMKEFHAMAAKEKASECSKDPNRSCKFYTSSENYSNEKVHYWRDVLKHSCHPLDQYIQFWPQNPTRYREVVGRYSVELRKLGLRILDLICEGLGLRQGYFRGGLSESPFILVNHYPVCPEPSLTLGLTKHRDPSVITILLQGQVHGLQVFKEDEWIGVEPLPHAFVVNIGHVLQIISNGKLKGAEHRAVTNSRDARTTAAYFIYPSDDCIIEPAKALINAWNPPIYRTLKFKDYSMVYFSKTAGAEAIEEFVSTKA